MRFNSGARADIVAAIKGDNISVPGLKHPAHWCWTMRAKYKLCGTAIIDRSTGRRLVFESEEHGEVAAFICAHAPKQFTGDRKAELRSLLQKYNRAHLPEIAESVFLRLHCTTCGVSAVQAAARQVLADQKKLRRAKRRAEKAARNERCKTQAVLSGKRQRRKLSAGAVAPQHPAIVSTAEGIAPTLRPAEGTPLGRWQGPTTLQAEGALCTDLVPGLVVCRQFASKQAQAKIYAALDSDEATQRSWGHLRIGAPSLHTYTTEVGACGGLALRSCAHARVRPLHTLACAMRVCVCLARLPGRANDAEWALCFSVGAPGWVREDRRRPACEMPVSVPSAETRVATRGCTRGPRATDTAHGAADQI